MTRVIIRKAVLHINLPLACRKCGAQRRSQHFKVEVEYLDLDGLRAALEQQQIGTHFPVGWASFSGEGGKTEYECPKCLEAK